MTDRPSRSWWFPSATTSGQGERRLWIWNALVAFGAPLAALTLEQADFVRPDQVIQIGLPPFRIDLMTSISGVQFADAWAGRLEGTLFDVQVAFIGREDFLRNKRASGRPKDLEDLRALEG